MRKVLYWDSKISEQKSGIFHCWAGTMQDAYAVIEDTTTGYISRRDDSQFRFVQPPETKTHSSETQTFLFKNEEYNSVVELLRNAVLTHEGKWQDLKKELTEIIELQEWASGDLPYPAKDLFLAVRNALKKL